MKADAIAVQEFAVKNRQVVGEGNVVKSQNVRIVQDVIAGSAAARTEFCGFSAYRVVRQSLYFSLWFL